MGLKWGFIMEDSSSLTLRYYALVFDKKDFFKTIFAHCATLIRKKVVKQGHPIALANQLTSSWRPIRESNKAEKEHYERSKKRKAPFVFFYNYRSDEKPASRGFGLLNWAETKGLIKANPEGPKNRPSTIMHES